MRSELVEVPRRANDAPLALIGMRAAGKTSVGRVLARRLEIPFVDLDEETLVWASRIGRPAPDVGSLLEREGVLEFRQLEAQVLRRLLEGGVRVVLATGGGAIERPDNRVWLKRCAFVVWLRAPAETLRRRMESDPTPRPALGGVDAAQEVEALLARRIDRYQEAADQVIDTSDRTVEEVAAHLAAGGMTPGHSIESSGSSGQVVPSARGNR